MSSSGAKEKQPTSHWWLVALVIMSVCSFLGYQIIYHMCQGHRNEDCFAPSFGLLTMFVFMGATIAVGIS